MVYDLVLLGSMQTLLIPLSLGGMTGAPANVSEIAKHFFKDLFLHPNQHIMALGFMAILVVGATLGTAFLIKKIYDSYQKPAPAPQP